MKHNINDDMYDAISYGVKKLKGNDPSIKNINVITNARPNLEYAQVIYNKPATILIVASGRKYVAKAHDEDFDEEKGLLMCLAKANGISHTQLKRVIKNAKFQEKSEV